jgi:hypothetical protein
MSKSKLNFTRTTTDKLTVKAGVLSEDCSEIAYTDENDCEQVVRVADLLAAFKNQVIDFSVALKTDEDLELLGSDSEYDSEIDDSDEM